MGSCCSDCGNDSTKNQESDLNLAEGEDNEIEFEYDEKTQRLVPIFDKNKFKSKHQQQPPLQDGEGSEGGRSNEQGGRGSTRTSPNQQQGPLGGMIGAEMKGDGSGGGDYDMGRSDDSMYDCMSNSNQSFDLTYGDDKSMVRMTIDGRDIMDDSGPVVDGDAQKGRKYKVGEGEGAESEGGDSREPSPESESATAMINADLSAVLADQQLQRNQRLNNTFSSSGSTLNSPHQQQPLTIQSLMEYEEISRSEVYAAFMVAIQMLRFAMKKITPTVHYLGKNKSNSSRFKNSNNDNNATTSSAASANPSTVITLHHKDVDLKPRWQSSQSSSSGRQGSAQSIIISGEENADPNNMLSQSVMTPIEGSGNNNNNNNNNSVSATSAATAAAGGGGQPNSSSLSSENQQQSVVSTPASVVPPPRSFPRVELLELDARKIPVDGKNIKVHFQEDWNFFKNSSEATKILNRGEAFHAFRCKVGNKCDADDLQLLAPLVNLSCYKDEQKENNVPFINPKDPADMGKYTCILNKCMYLVKGLEVGDIDASIWAGRKYCEACIAGASKFEYDSPEPDTFRMHKPIIPLVFTLVIQLRVSEVTDPAALKQLATIDGFEPARALLYERTKRDRNKRDGTAKAKAALLFTPVPGGMLVSNVVPVFNTQLPSFIAPIINNFGKSGAQETEEVAARTRKFLWEQIVIPRMRKQLKQQQEEYQKQQDDEEAQQQQQQHQQQQQQQQQNQQQKKKNSPPPLSSHATTSAVSSTL